jgi:predicted DNA-binding transcriptional regulator AlpA
MRRNETCSFHLQRRFVSEMELEQLTGISRRTWQKHRLFNRGPRYYKIYGSIRYDVDEVVAWIQGLAVTVGPAPHAEKLHHDQIPAGDLGGRR